MKNCLSASDSRLLILSATDQARGGRVVGRAGGGWRERRDVPKNLQLTCHGNRSIILSLGDSMHHGWPSTNSTPANALFFSPAGSGKVGSAGALLRRGPLWRGLDPSPSSRALLLPETPGPLGCLFAFTDESGRARKKNLSKNPSTVGFVAHLSTVMMPMARSAKRSRGTRLGGATGMGIGAERADDVRAASLFIKDCSISIVSLLCCANLNQLAQIDTKRLPPPRRGRSHSLEGRLLLPPQRLVLAEEQCERCHWLDWVLRGVVIRSTAPIRQASRSELCSHSKLSGLYSTTNVTC